MFVEFVSGNTILNMDAILYIEKRNDEWVVYCADGGKVFLQESEMQTLRKILEPKKIRAAEGEAKA